MHLVFVTSIVPDGAPSTGYEIANEAVISALRRAGVRVTVLGFTWPGSQPSDPDSTVVLGSVDVRTDNASAAQKAKWVATAMRLGLPVACAKMRILEPSAVRRALAAIEPFDGYVLNSVALPGAFEDCFTGKPSIYVAHNVEHRSASENATTAGSMIQRTLFAREARLLEALEARLCQNADYVFTFSEDDRVVLGLDRQRSAALPLTTRSGLPAPRNPGYVRYDCTLIGTWTWQPNRIGLEWFLNEVVPLLDDELSIAVAGNAAGDLKARYPAIHWAGRVADATEFVRSGAVVLLISRAGSGVQLKTIETFELGLPSVATRHSIRGIDNLPANCRVADAPQAFATALTRLVAEARNGGADLDGSKFQSFQRTRLDERVTGALGNLAPAEIREAV